MLKIKDDAMDGACSSIGEVRSTYKILVGESEMKRPRGRQGVDGRIILEWILKKYDGKL
jgi:hypothetical protein